MLMMERSFGRKCTALALAASIFAGSSTLTPKRSEAGIGLLLATVGGNPVVSVALFVAAVGAGAGAVTFFKKGWNSTGGKAFVNYLIAVASGFGAYVMLDGSGSQSAELKSLSAEGAQRLGLTESEWRSYESELPMVNALREEAMARTDADLKGLAVKTSADLEKVLQRLQSNWNAISEGVLAPETHSVIQRLGQAVVAQK